MRILNDPLGDVILMHPGESAISLEHALEKIDKRQKRIHEGLKDLDTYKEINTYNKVTLVFLDATWKYAKEMERACSEHKVWDENIIRVEFKPFVEGIEFESKATNYVSKNILLEPMPRGDISKEQNTDDIKVSCEKGPERSFKCNTIKHFKAKRFDIRTPPSENYLSTAECIAWVVSKVENNPLIYDTLMKPLDLMVEKWHTFSDIK
eukprot:CAMPEP_0184863350 /NCGR_PEP_ID=MMETSP0580-20130426/10596_1 /TAXON_ID=1118495 /ORGANISM="Dactyliosolen fragilissimus" /LENGTH=207 /DNA_ID=CAMNT_0027361635 /DNA_START=276 /DNA_END=899 /DNA_ORIENTATION=-